MGIRARITRVKDGESRLYESASWGKGLPGGFWSRHAQVGVWVEGVGTCNCFRHTLFEDAAPELPKTTVKCGQGLYRFDWVEEYGERLVQDDVEWSVEVALQPSPTPPTPTPSAPLPSWLALHPSWLPHLRSPEE